MLVDDEFTALTQAATSGKVGAAEAVLAPRRYLPLISREKPKYEESQETKAITISWFHDPRMQAKNGGSGPLFG